MSQFSNLSQAFLLVKDHSVSGEQFKLVYDEQYDLLFTTPQPTQENLPCYYQSEDYISHTSSKRNLLERLYHAVRQIALKQKRNFIHRFLHSGKLLDYGCGTGDFLATMKKSGWDVVGVEPNVVARRKAAANTKAPIYDVEEQLGPNGFYNLITLWHVLEHLPNYVTVLKNLTTALAEDGIMIIAVPNYKSDDADFYKEYWAAYDVPRHLWHFSQKSISVIAEELNFEVIDIHPMKFDSYYVALLSEKYKTGKLNYLSALWRGFQSNRVARSNGEYSSLIYVLKRKNYEK